MDLFVDNICRVALFALYRIGQIRIFLIKNELKCLFMLLLHAVCTNVTVSCMPFLNRKLITNFKKFKTLPHDWFPWLANNDSILTPTLHELHWLPVEYCNIYKISLLTYKCLDGMGPIINTNLLAIPVPLHNFRLKTSTTSTQYGRRSFSSAASDLCNDLPLHVKKFQTLAKFKSSLKTYLFTLAKFHVCCVIWLLLLCICFSRLEILM